MLSFSFVFFLKYDLPSKSVYMSCFFTVGTLSLHTNHSRTLMRYLTNTNFHNGLGKGRENVGH